MSPNQLQDQPKTISKSGKAPESRLGEAPDVGNRIRRMISADSGRSKRRALVKGLVDGNPPYRAGDLRANGRADACNVNWRQAESYLYSARNAFYDLRSEVPTFATIRTALGGPAKRKQWSDIITEEFQTLILRDDEDFDYEMQISDHEMTLYGCGPQVHEDQWDFRSVSAPCGNLLVPKYALSRATKWEECAVLVDYYVHDLYKRIRNPESAAKAGWDVKTVRDAIINACPKTRQGGLYKSWEWHQQELKNSCFAYSAQSDVVQCAHYYVREFPEEGEEDGKITHAIVLLAQHNEQSNDFLFKRVGRFENWREIIHPMYYDNDGGGYHHSVTGMGQKMYSAFVFQNRLFCNLGDKAFAPKVFFRALNGNAAEVMNIVKMGDWARVPAGFEAVQTPVGGYLEEGMALHRELGGIISANLSQYRQNLSKTSGNPLTATEVEMRASEQARLGKTQLSHYFNQCDQYYAEKYRRAANAKNKNLPGGKASLEFQERCEKRGVPIEALRDTEHVGATRIAGQGSPYLRQQAMMQLIQTSQLNPSAAGRENIYRDLVASLAGQMMVERYVPEITSHEATDQAAIAQLQVAAARTGVAPVVSPNQNSAVFMDAFVSAAAQALGTLEKGGNPQDIYNFIELIGPAAMQHLELLKQDPRNKKMVAQLEKAWKQIAQAHDKLGQQLQQMAQQQAQQQQMQRRAAAARNGTDPELALKAAQAGADNRRKDTKLANDMRRKDTQVRQKLAIADITTATKITNQHREQEAAEVSE